MGPPCEVCPRAERCLRGWGPTAGHPGRLGPARPGPHPCQVSEGRGGRQEADALGREPALPDANSGFGQATTPLQVPLPHLSNGAVGPCLPPEGVKRWEALERTRRRVRPCDGREDRARGQGKAGQRRGSLPGCWQDRREEGGVFLCGTHSLSFRPFNPPPEPWGRRSNHRGCRWGN